MAPAAQRDDDPRSPVGAPVTGVDLADLGGQALVLLGPFRSGRGGGEPFVETGTSHAQDPAQPGDAEGAAVEMNR